MSSNVLPFSLPPSRAVAISQATADLVIASDVITAFAMGSLTFKCRVVQAVVDSGREMDDLTVRELVQIIQQENAR